MSMSSWSLTARSCRLLCARYLLKLLKCLDPDSSEIHHARSNSGNKGVFHLSIDVEDDDDDDLDGVEMHHLHAASPLDDDITREHLTRNIQFFGEQPVVSLRNAFVVIVGVGGVGSHAAMALLRAGVGRLRVVDFDRVSLSSLNRHAVATRKDVGTTKVDALKAHCKAIFPEASVHAMDVMYTVESSDDVLAPWGDDGKAPDMVVDAIDNVDTKVHLLLTCRSRGVRVVASGGAAMKADPTRVRVGDIAECAVNDVLLRAVRLRLRKANGNADVPLICVASTERARMALWECPDDVPLVAAGDVAAAAAPSGNATYADLQVVPGFRVRTAPVVGTMPATFGLVIAHYVLCELTSNVVPMDPEPIARALDAQYRALLDNLREMETDAYGDDGEVHVTQDEVKYVARELWHCLPATGVAGGKNGKDARGGKLSLVRSVAALRLARFDGTRPASVDNLILLGWEDAEAHYASRCDVAHFVTRHGEAAAALARRCCDRARRDFMYDTNLVGDFIM